jgi:hypothetical protein
MKDPTLDISSIAPVTLQHAADDQLPTLPSVALANPLETRAAVAASRLDPPTQTLPARTVWHEAHAALKPLINGATTQEQLDRLVGGLHALRYSIPPT